MLLSDKEIKELVIENNLITPFEENLISKKEFDNDPSGIYCPPKTPYLKRIISHGLSSYGYDVRLSSLDFRCFIRRPGCLVDPHNFDADCLHPVRLNKDEKGRDFFVVPANSYGLGVTVETFTMPSDTTGLLLNKSTYVRCGIILPTTVIEAGWKGNITLEIVNTSPSDCLIYANEGIAQLLFLKGNQCEIDYGARNGKYQNQPEQVVLPK